MQRLIVESGRWFRGWPRRVDIIIQAIGVVNYRKVFGDWRIWHRRRPAWINEIVGQCRTSMITLLGPRHIGPRQRVPPGTSLLNSESKLF